MRHARLTAITRAATLLALALALAACAAPLRRFPLAPPLTVDPDTQPFSPPPKPYFSGFYGDGADQILLRPVARFFAVDPARESVNVNALDEVPDSSWYQNRAPADAPAARPAGPCDAPPLDPATPWTVTGAKPNGANPGFIVRDAAGRRFLLKFDTADQPQRATAADVIGSRLTWAAGYFAPCNRIVTFDAATLTIGDGATAEGPLGEKTPLTREHIAATLALAPVQPDGRYRAASSLFLPGRPLGPFRYEDTRPDDPNDVVEHDDRRELRAAKLLAAWLNHFDAREQNSLDIWIETAPDTGYVRHYMLDFGDTLGSTWPIAGMSERLGHSHYFDFNWLARDFFSLGARRRPWEQRQLPADRGATFGYFDADHFDPEAWKPGYPNPAFLRMSERDAAWMARKLARLTRADIAAAVREAQLTEPAWQAWLIDTLEARLRKILERYLARLSPLDRPALERDAGTTALCLEDPLPISGVVAHHRRSYSALAYDADRPGPPRALPSLPRPATPGGAPAGVCAALPDSPPIPQEIPAYFVVDLSAATLGDDAPPPPPARVHLVRLPDGSWHVAGLERPPRSRPPRL
jgi:hypothetical protein